MAAKTRGEIAQRWANDPEYVEKIIADAVSRNNYITDRLAPQDQSKIKYVIDWDLVVEGESGWEEKVAMQGKCEADADAAKALTTGLGVLAAPGGIQAGLQDLQALPALQLQPHQVQPTPKAKPKAKPKPKPTPKPDAEKLEPEPTLKKARNLCKSCLKSANEARGYSIELGSLRISDQLAEDGWGKLCAKRASRLKPFQLVVLHAPQMDLTV